jgi:hypothetical protein
VNMSLHLQLLCKFLRYKHSTSDSNWTYQMLRKLSPSHVLRFSSTGRNAGFANLQFLFQPEKWSCKWRFLTKEINVMLYMCKWHVFISDDMRTSKLKLPPTFNFQICNQQEFSRSLVQSLQYNFAWNYKH